MTFNNIQKSFSIGNLNTINQTPETEKLLSAIDLKLKSREIKNNCKSIASGILVRLNIQPEANELTTLIGNSVEKNNLDAVTKWVQMLSPEQDSVSPIEIDEFTRQLLCSIDEHLQW